MSTNILYLLVAQLSKSCIHIANKIGPRMLSFGILLIALNLCKCDGLILLL